jgi:multidrug transporter EmrE-like cation transporter
VPVDAFLLALGAAVLHAAWNVLLAGARDTRAATAGALALVAAVSLPAAVLTWDVDAAALPYLVASISLEIAYFVLLAAAYARADLGIVYPIARGSAPVLVLAAAAVLGRGDPSAVQVAGVVLVAGGVLALRGGATPAAAREMGLALAVGATIAGYVLADDAGLDHAATIPYLCLVVGVPGAVYAAAFAVRTGAASVRSVGFALGLGARVLDARERRRSGRRHAARSGWAALRREMTPRTAAVAAGMISAFGLALAALSLADPAPVAAIREGSVVIAALAAPRVLGESGGRARVVGAAAVFAGVAAVAAG